MTVANNLEWVFPKIDGIFRGYNTSKIQSIINYNVRGGKNTRYDIISHVALSKMPKDKETMQLIELLGFCVEVFHASFLMSDDIVDNSKRRRGKECFYFKRGMKTLRDSKFFIGLIYKLLKTEIMSTDYKSSDYKNNECKNSECKSSDYKNSEYKNNDYKNSECKSSECKNNECKNNDYKNNECKNDSTSREMNYLHNLVPLIQKCFYNTCLGQMLDTKNKVRSEYTFNLYRKICELKTSSYSVYMPLACGYYLSGRDCPEYLEELSNLIGIIYQMNDDYLNFFPDKTNKSSNDLEEYKLTYFTARLNEDTTSLSPTDKSYKPLNMFFNREGVSDLKDVIFNYFETYETEKEALVKKSKELIKKEDEKELYYLYDILLRYELKK